MSIRNDLVDQILMVLAARDIDISNPEIQDMVDAYAEDIASDAITIQDELSQI